jgi:hypothetical protein
VAGASAAIAGASVKTIYLSNHPAAMLQDIHARHETAAHEAVAQHAAQLAARQQERDRARADRQWWTWLKSAVAVWRTRRSRPRLVANHPDGPDADREAILTAGMKGENKVADELGAALGDEWTLLRGYRNRRGEIDHILLGPGGVFAIEVKYRNATIAIDGDQWWFDKYDRYGNLVDQGGLADGRGRPPSVQLSEPTAELEGFLRSRGQPVRAQRVVIFSHPRSVVGSCRNLTIDLVSASAGDLVGLARRSPGVLGPGDVAEVESLVVRDHRFHHQQSPRSPRLPRSSR